MHTRKPYHHGSTDILYEKRLPSLVRPKRLKGRAKGPFWPGWRFLPFCYCKKEKLCLSLHSEFTETRLERKIHRIDVIDRNALTQTPLGECCQRDQGKTRKSKRRDIALSCGSLLDRLPCLLYREGPVRMGGMLQLTGVRLRKSFAG